MFKKACMRHGDHHDTALSPAFAACRKHHLQSQGKAAREIAPSFLRCFSTADGEKVLAWLHSQYLCNALGPDADDKMLRYREGQRALILQIERLIAQAKSGQ